MDTREKLIAKLEDLVSILINAWDLNLYADLRERLQEITELKEQIKQDQQAPQKNCNHCKYFEGKTYHDKMYCRDCRQMDRFSKQDRQAPEMSMQESYCTKCKKVITDCTCTFKDDKDANKHSRIRQISKAPEMTDEKIMKLVNALDGMDEYEQITKVRKWVRKYAQLRSEQRQDEVQQFMTDVHNWADETFGKKRTALAPLYHLKKEVDEAIETMKTHNSLLTIEELADCFILILNASSKYKLTFEELFNAAKEKMQINKTRKWGKSDKNGVVEHIKESEQIQEISDEEINKEAYNRYLSWVHKVHAEVAFNEGAKWMRDKIKKQ